MEDKTDSDDEDQGMTPETPPLLPAELLAEWEEMKKAEEPTEVTDKNSEADEEPTGDPTAEEVGEEVGGAQGAKTEGTEAETKSSGVNARRKR